MNRLIAQEAGEKYYESKPCRTCSTPLRYTSSGSCVECCRTKGLQRYHGQTSDDPASKPYNQIAWRENRQRARAQGLIHYHGKNCQTCNSMLRYTCNKACVECHTNRMKQAKKPKHLQTDPEARNLKGRQNPVKVMLDTAKHRARKAGREFNLTEADIVIPSHCPVLGIPLEWGGDRNTSPSLDRLDSNKGYTPDNVNIISTRANTLKSNGTIEEFEALVKWLKSMT